MASHINLVTGGAGFIGSHLCDALIARGDHVICLDNMYTGSRSNIVHLVDFANFELVRQDVTEPYWCEADRIFNLACPASPVHYQKNPIRTLETNMLGASRMLELARRNNARILQASTSEVYGEPLVHPQTEQYWGNVNPVGTRSCYDEGKRVAETLMIDYATHLNVDTCIVRIFNTYGPRMAVNDGRVVSNMIVQALRNDPITVYGDGSQTRSLCYVSDMVDGLIRMMDSTNIGPINLGNPEEVTILRLATEIKAMTNSNSEIVFKSLPADDPSKRKPDIKLAQEFLGWHPTVTREVGLSLTIEYLTSVVNFGNR